MVLRLFLVSCALAGITAFAQPPVEGAPKDLASLRYIDITQGTGADAAPGKRYTVHYTGWLTNGTKFDSSVDRNEPLDFIQGRRQVIAGWDLGFEGMKVGGKRRLLIPYQLAYGEAGTGPIPPKAELIFDVELLNVSDAPTVIPAVDLLRPFLDLSARTLDLAKDFPAEKYSWKPNDSGRSFAQILMRVADSTKLLDSLAGDDIKAEEFQAKLDEFAKTPPPDKDTILNLLQTNFAEVRKDLESARNGFLSGDAELFGQPTTKRGVLTRIDTTIAEQLEQLIVYAHENGITLPWTAAELR